MLHKLTLITALITIISGPTALAGATADAINTIANGEHRSIEHRARNAARHPGETLEFFGIQPDMTVVEISPGGAGWYTEILAPYLKDNGTYYAGSYDPESENEYAQRNSKRYNDKLAQNPAIYSKVIATVFSVPDNVQAAPEGSADMVVTFRNMHGWMRDGNQATALKVMYSYLKPGGTLGLIQHRGDPNNEQDPTASKGYIQQSLVITLAESVGFVLEAKSELNANPKDSKDHPQGVWNLPPGYRDGDQDRAKYQAIGESDRMTLRFRKPE